MKKILYTFLLMNFICGITYAAPGKGYKIAIKVNGLKNDTAFLANYYGDKTYLQDTATIDSKGLVTFQKKKDLQGGIYMFVVKKKKLFEFFVTGKDDNFSMETDTSDYLKEMKIKNSLENQLFYDYMNYLSNKSKDALPLRDKIEKLKKEKASADVIKVEQDKMQVLDKEVKAYISKVLTENATTLFAKFIKANQEIEIPEAPLLANGKKDSTFAYRYYKAHFWDNIDFTDDRLIKTPVYHTKLDTYIKKMTYQIPDSINKSADIIVEKSRPSKELFKYTVWYITNQYENSNIMGMDAVFVHMAQKYYDHVQTPWVDSTTLFKIQDKARKTEPILIGKKAPNVICKDSLGLVHNLYAVPNKYTILYFWDPDCGHCQKATPVLAAKYDSIKQKGAEVFAVGSSLRAEYSKWTSFIRKHNLRWINVADPDYQSNFRYEYDLQSYPQMFVLDKDKKIIGKKMTPEQVLDFLDKVQERDRLQKALK